MEGYTPYTLLTTSKSDISIILGTRELVVGVEFAEAHTKPSTEVPALAPIAHVTLPYPLLATGDSRATLIIPPRWRTSLLPRSALL